MSSSSRGVLSRITLSKGELLSNILFIALLIAVFNLERILEEKEELEEINKFVALSADMEIQNLNEENQRLLTDIKNLKSIIDSMEKIVDDKKIPVTTPAPVTPPASTKVAANQPTPAPVDEPIDVQLDRTEPILENKSFLEHALIQCNRQGSLIRNEKISLEFIIFVNKNGKASNVQLSDNNPELRGADLRLSKLLKYALRKSSYKPGSKNNDTVSMSYKLRRTYGKNFCG